MSREEYDRRFEADECPCEFCEAVTLTTDEEIEAAIQGDEDESYTECKIDWLGITRAFG